jgi:hypothetical protein
MRSLNAEVDVTRADGQTVFVTSVVNTSARKRRIVRAGGGSETDVGNESFRCGIGDDVRQDEFGLQPTTTHDGGGTNCDL